MSKITAVVTLSSKSVSTYNAMQGTTELKFAPDYADGRNKEWATNTPSLALSMSVKTEIGERFEFGKTYLLTFEHIES